MPTILTKKSDTPGAVPSTANLTNLAGGAELAVNTADKRLFSMNSSSAIIEVGTNPSSLTCADASFTVARVGSLTITSLTLTNATVTSATVTTLTGTSANITTLSGTNLSYGSATITTGNLTFSSTAQRITGDFSNATLTNRLSFQTSTANSNTTIGVLPNGTGQTGQLNLYGSSDPANTSVFAILSSTSLSEARLASVLTGTGTYLPMTFYTGGSERVRIDTSGNVGIGTASPVSKLNVLGPSAVTSFTGSTRLGVTVDGAASTNDYSGIDFTSGGGNLPRSRIASYFGGGGSYLQFGTSNNYGSGITNTALTIDPSGNVGIGTASPGSKLSVVGPSAFTVNGDGSTTPLILQNNNTPASPSVPVVKLAFDNNGFIKSSINAAVYNNDYMTFNVGSDTERMRIDSSGNVGIGVTTFGNRKLETGGTLPSSGGYSYAVLGAGTFPSGATTEANCFTSFPATQAASFTIPALNHFIAVQSTFGASSVVTNQYGFRVDSSLTGATNNYGFYSNIAAASNRWNFYAAGTAENYMAGRLGIGNSTFLDSEMLRITQASAKVALFVEITAASSTGNPGIGIRKQDNDNTTNQTYVSFTYNAGGNGAGGIQGNGANGVQFYSSSDARLKENVVDLDGQLAKILALKPRKFDFINGPKDCTGFIAQEMETVYPDSVGEDVDGFKTIGGISVMEARLIKAIQELTARVAELEAK
jgi:hypothetical protein